MNAMSFLEKLQQFEGKPPVMFLFEMNQHRQSSWHQFPFTPDCFMLALVLVEVLVLKSRRKTWRNKTNVHLYKHAARCSAALLV